eukprot:2440305-Prymnesium_polylepis.1
MAVLPARPEGVGAATRAADQGVFNGDAGDKKKDYARTGLLFNAQPLTGEVWRELEGGLGKERAWRVVTRYLQWYAFRGRRRL